MKLSWRCSAIKLRPYQTQLINDTREAFRTHRRILSVLPCGGGKTVLFAYMSREHVLRGGVVHFYVHRRELLTQAQNTFTTFGLPTDNIYIGMVQSRKIPDTTPTLIIFDEAHHSTANTWRIITERYPNALVVGLTATPKRTDGSTLANDFDILVEGVDANYLIDNGYLAPYDYYAPKLSTISQSDILLGTGKDYDGVAVGEVLLKNKIYGDILKYLNPERKTIIYSPSVAFSQSLTALGVTHVDGNTPKQERDIIINKFRSGEIMHLSNVDLFGEGFDIPDCEVVILLRPTKSTVLFIQQSMRALRYRTGKRATIYDLVGNVFTHGLPTDYNNWELTGKLTKKNNQAYEISVRMCEKCYRVYSGISPICSYCQHDNGKTQAQIKHDQAVELEKIEAIKRRERKYEQSQATTLDELIALGKARGYKNPAYWAKNILKSRRSKL